jgi:membrane-bound lytic murein transglycosylase D
MKKSLLAIVFITSTLFGTPTKEALTASLQSIDCYESFDKISVRGDPRENYGSSFKAHMKRYQATQEEYEVIEKKFKAADIPLFFSLIPYCESNFKKNSRGNGTAGLWQFMAQSGRTYGLTIKKGYDERTDICLSTDAAIRYIKDLKKEFGSWYLADFAYGMGEIKLKRLIKKNGSKKASTLLNDSEFPKGTREHFNKTLLLDAAIHHSNSSKEPTMVIEEEAVISDSSEPQALH